MQKKAVWAVFAFLWWRPDAAGQTGLQYFDFGQGGTLTATAVDAGGNLYAAGTVVGSTVPVYSNAYDSDVRVVKRDAAGRLVYSYTFGGGENDKPTALAVAADGSVLVAGWTDSPDFPLVNPLFPTVVAGPRAGFLARLDPSGSRLVSSSKLGGPSKFYLSGVPLGNEPQIGGATANALALDASGNVYLTGSTVAGFVPATVAASGNPAIEAGNVYAFVMKLDAALGHILYTTYLGGSGGPCVDPFGNHSYCPSGHRATQSGLALAVDGSGNAIVAGSTNGAFPNTAGPGFGGPAFVSKINQDGSKILWSVPFGDAGYAYTLSYVFSADPVAVSVSATGDLVVAGNTNLPTFPVSAGAAQGKEPQAGVYSQVGYVIRFNGTGSAILASTLVGGSGVAALKGMTVDGKGNIWVAGNVRSGDFPALPSTVQMGNDFVAVLSPQLDQYRNIQRLPDGTSGVLTVDAGGNAVMAGTSGAVTRGTDLTGGGNGGLAAGVYGVANTAGLQVSPNVVPGALLTFYGVGLGPAAAAAAVPGKSAYGTALGGVQVTFDGNPAPLLYAAAGQINAVVPMGPPYNFPSLNSPFVPYGKTTLVRVSFANGASQTMVLPVVASEPYLFNYPVANTNVTGGTTQPYVVAQNEDGTWNSAANPAAMGSVMTLYANGTGYSMPWSPDGTVESSAGRVETAIPVSVWFLLPFHLAAEVDSISSVPGLVAGVVQLKVRLPPKSAGLPTGTNWIWIQAGNAATPVVGLYLK